MSSASKLTQAYLACFSELVDVVQYAYDNPLSVGTYIGVRLNELPKRSESFYHDDFLRTIIHSYDDETREMEEQLEDEEDEETVRALKAKIEHREKVFHDRLMARGAEKFELLHDKFELDVKKGLKEYAQERARYKAIRAGG